MTGARLLDNLPASVELAAGSGKTWTLADTVRTIANEDGRALVLTHTVAGVHAMSAKLREFEVEPTTYHVATITSFAIELVTAYTSHAGFDVPDDVDLSRASEYVQGAATVLRRRHIQDVYATSFSHLLVDEYQDCTRAHHDLVLTLKQAIPRTVVFGDRLQGIFGFADPIVDWETDVQEAFPNFPMVQVPHRWAGHNEELGAWLLEIRPNLVAGNVMDLSSGLPLGVAYRPRTPAGFELINAAREQRGDGESVVVITAPFLHMPRAVASRLQGYAVMEEMGGSFMANALGDLARLEPVAYSSWLCALVKECFTGYARLNKPVQARLAKGKPVSSLSRPGLEQTLAALDRVQVAPTLGAVAEAMREIRGAREAQLHSREAWQDMTAVIEGCGGLDPERHLVAELGRARQRVRHGGRGRQLRVVSRTVLIKGLEYDHVIVANVADISDACNLYVALSRARKSVTIIGPSPQVTIKETKKG